MYIYIHIYIDIYIVTNRHIHCYKVTEVRRILIFSVYLLETADNFYTHFSVICFNLFSVSTS